MCRQAFYDDCAHLVGATDLTCNVARSPLGWFTAIGVLKSDRVSPPLACLLAMIWLGFFAQLLAPAVGWAHTEHKVGLRLALRFVSPSAIAMLERHLGQNGEAFLDTLDRAAVWADSEEVLTAFPESAKLHYINIPSHSCQRPIDLSVSCPENACIVGAIEETLLRLVDLEQSADWAEALKFLIHFLLDIHQPLHVGFEEDRGGNWIHLESPKMTLHQVWDFELFSRFRGAESVADVVTRLHIQAAKANKTLMDANQAVQSVDFTDQQSVQAFALGLASDTASRVTCTYAYREVSGEVIGLTTTALSPTYMQVRQAVAANQLIRASVKLAFLLDRIAVIHKEFRTAARAEANLLRPAALGTRPHSPLASPNRFAVLDMEFEPDEYLYEEGETSDEDGESLGVFSFEELLEPPPPVFEEELLADLIPAEDIQASGVQVSESLSQMEKRRLRRRKLQQRRKLYKVVFEGVHVHKFVLLRKFGQLYVTLRELATKEYLPRSVLPMKVTFGRNALENREISVNFDSEAFHFVRPSTALIAVMFSHFKGEDAPNGEFSSVLESQFDDSHIPNGAGRYTKGVPFTLAETLLWDVKTEAERDHLFFDVGLPKLAAVGAGKVLYLTDSTKPPGNYAANKFDVKILREDAPELIMSIIIDRTLYDENLTVRINKYLYSVVTGQIILPAMASKKNTLQQEMEEIEGLITGRINDVHKLRFVQEMRIGSREDKPWIQGIVWITQNERRLQFELAQKKSFNLHGYLAMLKATGGL